LAFFIEFFALVKVSHQLCFGVVNTNKYINILYGSPYAYIIFWYF